MNKNIRKLVGKAVIMSMAFTTVLPQSIAMAASNDSVRIGERDRYATAAKVALSNWQTSDNVVLVSGEGYADAVSATALAKKLDCPILLTRSSSLNYVTKDALKTLKAKNIYVIGGNASVSKNCRGELKLDKYNLIELGGKDRYETNILVAKKLIKLGVSAKDVMVVNGQGFSDALSAAPIAALKNQILLLTSNNPSKETLDFIKEHNSNVTAIGTDYTINEDTYKLLGATRRVKGGEDRFETNLNILKEYKSDFNFDKVFIANASGNGYADALVASVLSGKNNSGLVLMDKENSKGTLKAVDYVKRGISDSTTVIAIGGKAVLPDVIIDKIENKKIEKLSPTVKSVETVGLNQIKVQFNTRVDEDGAENGKNYEIDGENLKDNASFNAELELQDDLKTVLITLSKPYMQNDSMEFKVKNTIIDDVSGKTVEEYSKNITFLEVNSPKLESVKAVGGNKVIVKFSQPIRMNRNSLKHMKINRQSVENYDLNWSMTKFTGAAGDFASGVELYFDYALPIGENRFSVKAGEVGDYFDNAAKFPLKATKVSFEVENAEGTPIVKKVTMDNVDTMYITFDRPMDKQTALDDSNYSVNGKNVNVSKSDISFDDDSNDAVVKIEDVSNLFDEGENKVLVKKYVKDTYGNDVKEKEFTVYRKEDTSKPEITSCNILDGDTIRIKFNKEVYNSSAETKSNYKVIDEYGSDISHKIDDVDSVSSSSNNYRRIYDIKFKNNSDLKGHKYTLTVKNVEDLNSNVMDTFTKDVYGTDDKKPNIDSVVKVSGENEIVVFFNKPMNENSILNKDNYFYIDDNDDVKDLPKSTDIETAQNNKVAILTISSSYINKMDDFGIRNVKDSQGNELIQGAVTKNIETSSNDGPELEDDTCEIFYEGDDIKVKLTLSDPLDILNVRDFTVDGETPDAGRLNGNDVILIFKKGVDNGEKIDNIKDAGKSTTVRVSSGRSVDVAGRSLKSGSDTLILPPSTDMDSWKAFHKDFSNGDGSVTIEFNQDIDDDIEDNYIDDFIFVNERTGNVMKPVSSRAENKKVVYRFDEGKILKDDKIKVCATSQKSSINIRGLEDDDKGYKTYVPTSEHMRGTTIKAR